MYDVAVSGAGPAGSCAARLCALGGMRTILIERERCPREKCCAGGVLDRALKQLDFMIPNHIVEKEINGFTIVRDGFREDFRFEKRAGITVKRSKFDAYLVRKAEEAGVEFVEDTSVTSVKEDDSVTIGTSRETLEARCLIIAEGVTSSSASRMFGPYPGKNMGMGMAATFELRSDPIDNIEIHLMGTPTSTPWENVFPLNGWLFPNSNAANIGVAGKRSDLDSMRRAIADIKKMANDRYEVEAEGRIRAHPIPLLPRHDLSSKHCLAIGDAAGLANPITGEGMTYAIGSARLGAEAVIDHLNNGAELDLYDTRLRKEFISDLRAARIIGPRLHWLVGVVSIDRFFEIFHRSDVLVNTCLSIARGEENWRQLLERTIPRFPGLFFSSLGRSQNADVSESGIEEADHGDG